MVNLALYTLNMHCDPVILPNLSRPSDIDTNFTLKNSDFSHLYPSKIGCQLM